MQFPPTNYPYIQKFTSDVINILNKTVEFVLFYVKLPSTLKQSTGYLKMTIEEEIIALENYLRGLMFQSQRLNQRLTGGVYKEVIIVQDQIEKLKNHIGNTTGSLKNEDRN